MFLDVFRPLLALLVTVRTYHFFKVLGAGMAHGHGCMMPGEKGCHRGSHDPTTTDDHSTGPLHLHTYTRMSHLQSYQLNVNLSQANHKKVVLFIEITHKADHIHVELTSVMEHIV